MKKRGYVALGLAAAMVLTLSACGGGAKPAATAAPATTAAPAATTAATAATTAAPAETKAEPKTEAPTEAAPAGFELKKDPNMYIAYKAGGGSDRMFRAFQPYLEKYCGKTINPVYLPGAGGLIGWTSLLSTNPDGFSIGVLNIPSATAPIVSGEAAFNVDSFEYLGGITYEPPLLIIAKGNSWGIETLEDLIKYAKENPGKVTIAHTGTGGDEYISIKTFAKKAEIEVKDVPFEDTASAAAACLGGHVYCAMTSAYAVSNYLEQDQVIGLAMGSKERVSAYDSIPTFGEYGVDLVMGGIRGIVAPLGIPQEAIDFWVDCIEKMVKDPEYVSASLENGTALQYLSPEEFKAAHQALYEEYAAFYQEEPW